VINPLVSVIILNWNGYQDTIQCLESILKLEYANYRIVICDNGSTDGSVEQIELWCKDRQIDLANLESNPDSQHKYITLIQTGKNLGFAGGNNIGIRHALLDRECKYVWILNNDTIVEPNSLSALVSKCDLHSNIGICGSKLIYHHDRSTVQAWGGGKYNKWSGISQHIGAHQLSALDVDVESIEQSLDYIIGASMLVSRSFLETIGLMNEEYFLYFEELDWIARAGNQYSLGYCHDSIVYHKEGASTGLNSNQSRGSSMTDYHAKKSLLIYTRNYAPYTLPLIYLNLVMVICKRLIHGEYHRALTILKIIFATPVDWRLKPQLQNQSPPTRTNLI
jgi:GT2 family glycosyltransferase